ncbi:RNI-like protein [Hesseltinella vesiculosa]|uniref:RNI-like protein n=1 Tax=Hesseltinella vesiculosa TaxID=101127 RepID=A0A1X2GVM9_9FUNG|nr:RNI-like protein [Hesseltinella vesiculosa]
MSNRSRNNVRGPRSALTSFLEEHGIVVPNVSLQASRRRREQRRLEEQQQQQEAQGGQQQPAADTPAENETAAAAEGGTTHALLYTPPATTSRRRTRSRQSQDIIEQAQASAANKKKHKKLSKRSKKDSDDDDTDDDDDDDGYNPPNDFGEGSSSNVPRPRTLRAFCAKCKRRFTSMFTPGNQAPTTCPECLSGDAPAPVKKRRTTRNNNRTTLPVWKKKKFGVPSLQDICTNVVAECIDDVETLGIIGEDNLDRIAKIICRNRKLDNRTARFFHSPRNRQLTLYDCSYMDTSTLKNVAQFNPFLRTLNLYYCGRMNDEVLRFYGQHLQELTSIALAGCQLITAAAWQDFFTAVGTRLASFSLRHSRRFQTDAFSTLLATAPNLKHLRLNRIVTLDDAWLELLVSTGSHLQLETLELSWLQEDYYNVRSFTTERMVQVLQQTGGSLRELTLRGCTDMTDDLLLKGILPHCPQLLNLTLEGCINISGKAFKELFDQWQKSPGAGLQHLSLARCLELDDDALQSLITHTHQTLTHLNINSLNRLTAASLESLAALHQRSEDQPLFASTPADDTKHCSHLTFLDASFVQSMDDFVLAKLVQSCSSLKHIKVFGCPLVSEVVKVPHRLTLEGCESQTL